MDSGDIVQWLQGQDEWLGPDEPVHFIQLGGGGGTVVSQELMTKLIEDAYRNRNLDLDRLANTVNIALGYAAGATKLLSDIREQLDAVD